MMMTNKRMREYWLLRWHGGIWFMSSMTSWTFSELAHLYPYRDFIWINEPERDV